MANRENKWKNDKNKERERYREFVKNEKLSGFISLKQDIFETQGKDTYAYHEHFLIGYFIYTYTRHSIVLCVTVTLLFPFKKT